MSIFMDDVPESLRAFPQGRPRHVPVLAAEVLEALAVQPGQVIVDATVGGGGHAQLLAQRVGSTGRLIGLDQDPAMLELARPILRDLPVTLVHANFDQLREVLRSLELTSVDAVLADLGFCSDQVDNPQRGLSFSQQGPLDMRLDPTRGEPASALLKRLGERDLADLIYEFGEERKSRRIARKIVEARQRAPSALETTEDFAYLVRGCFPRPGKGQRTKDKGYYRIDPVTRTFQALRIAVNDELGALDGLLSTLPGCVKVGGRVAIISFHSLEDRRVKKAFRESEFWEPLTRKPVQAGDEEVDRNPRARSAKLRSARRMGPAVQPRAFG